MKQIVIIGLTLSLFSGCAFKSDAYQVGKDTYTVTGTSDYGYGGARNQAMKGAAQTCTRLGKYMQIKNEQKHHSFLFWSVDLTFLCINDDDNDYKRTQMRKDNGTQNINLNIK